MDSQQVTSEVPESDVRTLVVDDSEAFLEVAADVLGATPGFVSVGVVSSPDAALGLLVSREPGLAIIDVHMPQIDGLELTRRFKELRPETAVALISADDPEHLPPGVRDSKADAVIDKRHFGPRWLRSLLPRLASH